MVLKTKSCSLLTIPKRSSPRAAIEGEEGLTRGSWMREDGLLAGGQRWLAGILGVTRGGFEYSKSEFWSNGSLPGQGRCAPRVAVLTPRSRDIKAGVVGGLSKGNGTRVQSFEACLFRRIFEVILEYDQSPM
jgi:hypothetical protein